MDLSTAKIMDVTNQYAHPKKSQDSQPFEPGIYSQGEIVSIAM